MTKRRTFTKRTVVEGTPLTRLFHRGPFGTFTVLRDETGQPVNFEGKPKALARATKAMKTADILWNGANDAD